MIDTDRLALFVAASLVLAFTPGPNWLYLIARTVAQGRRAGLVSFGGTTLGLFSHMLAAALGLTALLMAVPLAYDAIRIAGALYLLWLAWSTIRGAAGPQLLPGELARADDGVLFRQAVLTSVLNPKVALFYLALLPQFIDVGRASVLAQSIALGLIQIAITAVVDLGVVLAASAAAGWIVRRPALLRARWALGSTFGALAAWLALDRRQS